MHLKEYCHFLSIQMESWSVKLYVFVFILYNTLAPNYNFWLLDRDKHVYFEKNFEMFRDEFHMHVTNLMSYILWLASVFFALSIVVSSLLLIIHIMIVTEIKSCEQRFEGCIGHRNFTKSLKNHSSHTCSTVGENSKISKPNECHVTRSHSCLFLWEVWNYLETLSN